MQNLMIVHKPDIAWLVIDLQVNLLANIHQNLEGFLYDIAHGFQFVEAVGRQDIPMVKMTIQVSRMPLEDRHRPPRLHALGHFAPPISVHRTEESPQKRRCPAPHFVINRHGARDLSVTARLRLAPRQQCGDIGGVRMEPERPSRPVPPLMRILCRVMAQIADMPY